MKLTPAVLLVLIAATSAQDDHPFGFTVSGDGPWASINFWWKEYPCNTSLTYNLELCQLGSSCVRVSTDIAEYTLRNRSEIAVVFWSHYHVTVNGTCGNTSLRLQEFYADTGPGELLPLQSLSVFETDGRVKLGFVKCDSQTQNASESLELVICDIRAEECREPKTFPTTAEGYEVPDAEHEVLYSASVRLTKKFEGKYYSSVNMVIPFIRGNTTDRSQGNYTVGGYGPDAEIELVLNGYECDPDLVSHDVVWCSFLFGCAHETTRNETTHALRGRPELPIIFWSFYDVYTLTTCNGTAAGQENIIAFTGPGDLVPLTDLPVVPDEEVAIVSFRKPDWRLQNFTRNIEVTVCDVEATTCVETRTVPLETESIRLDRLGIGILYNVSAHITFQDGNETYTSPDETSFFTLGKNDDVTGIGYNVTGNGPNAEVSLLWKQYPCAKGPITYNLTFCLNGFGCVEDTTMNETTYTLRTRPRFPVLFWNSYYVTIVGVCDGAPVKDQDVHIRTGPGELLPLKRFYVSPEADAVKISFEIPDNGTQSVAQNVDVSICDTFTQICLDPKRLSIKETSYRFGGLNRSVAYDVSARLSVDFKNETFTSRATTISVVTEASDDEVYPPVRNVRVVDEQTDSEDNVTLTVQCDKPADTTRGNFDGIYVEVFDDDEDVSVMKLDADGTQVQIPNLKVHTPYRISVRAMYSVGSGRKESVGHDVAFFTSAGDATKSGFAIVGEGPRANISVWWEEFPCRRGPASYKVNACLGDTCIHHATGYTNTTLSDGYGLPMLFWNTYHITIEATCIGSAPVKWQELYASTGLGELLPLQMLTVVPDGHAVNISYVKPNKLTQNVAENVEIVFCDVLEPVCFETRKVPIEEKGHRFDDLKFGVLYNVSARLTKEVEGEKYTSKALSSNFSTAATNETEYPPVTDLSVTFEPAETDENVRVRLTCSKPADTRGKPFRGIFVELFDDQMSKITTSVFTETQIDLPSLPLFRTFSVIVYAVYSEERDALRSVGQQLAFFTHIGGVFVPQPEIVKLVPVNGTTALISWTHSSKESLVFKYKITRKQVSSDEVTVVDPVSPQTRTLLLEDFKPDEKYTVNITAYTGTDQIYENSSDVRELTMLPKDALIPTLEVKRLEPKYQLELTWNVLISPEIQKNCTFLALACPYEAACDDRTLTSDLKTVTIEIMPYTNYTLRVRTKCELESDIHVIADSNLVQYNTSEILAPVHHIHQKPINRTAVALKWSTLPNQTYTGFYVQYTQIDGDGYWTDSESSVPELILTDLQPASVYNVSVKAVRQYGKRRFLSEPTSTEVFSMFEAPPPLSELTVKQVEHTSRVKVSWSAVASDFGSLVEYKVVSICTDTEIRFTNATEIEFKPTKVKGYETECVVKVASCVKNLRNIRNCSATTGMSEIFRTLHEPKGAEGEYSSDKVYRVTILVPEEYGNLTDLEYQITEESGEYGPRVNRNDKAVTSESRYDDEVKRKARLCINDLCGDEIEFSFKTNVGAPSIVNDLQADVDVTNFAITWKKPDTLNGPLDGYFLTISETRSGEVVVSKNLKENFLKIKMDKEYTSYDIDVRAYNIDKVNPNITKNSFDSTIKVMTDGTEPPPPSKLEELSSQGHSRIEWEPTPSRLFNVTWFRVVAKSSEDNASITFTQNTVFEFSVLRPYTFYDFEVSSCTAQDNATCGSPSKLTKQTDVGYPSAPTVMLVHADLDFIFIRWTEPVQPFGPINGYQFAYAETSSGRTPRNWTDTPSGERSAKLTDLAPKTEYMIHVRAFNLNTKNEPLYSSVGFITQSTEGASNGAVLISLLSVLSVLAVCALAYFGYTRYMQRVRETPLISMGPQTHPSPALEEVDL